MDEFTQTKFLHLSAIQQHKHLARLLRMIYEKMLNGLGVDVEWSQYRQMEQWLKMSPFACQMKEIANRYHLHLQLAHMSHKEHNLLPSIHTHDRDTAEPAWSITVYLDHIRSTHNVGSIIRTVEAFALGSVCLSKNTPSIDHKQVKDAAMGTADWVNCQKTYSLDDLPRPLILMETSPEATSIHEFIFPESFTLVVGNEEFGCSDEMLGLADFMIQIPLRGRKNSLNVANAFAIAASEISRQKSIIPKRRP